MKHLIEVDSHTVVVSVTVLDQHRAVKEVMSTAFNMVDYKDAAVEQTPEELTLTICESREVKSPLWTPRELIGTSGILFWSIQTGVRCAKRCMMKWIRRIGSPCVTLCGRRRSGVVIKKRLLWELSEKNGAGETYLDENEKGQVENRALEPRDFWKL